MEILIHLPRVSFQDRQHEPNVMAKTPPSPVHPQRITDHLAVCQELASIVAEIKPRLLRCRDDFREHEDFARFVDEFNGIVAELKSVLDAERIKGDTSLELSEFVPTNSGHFSNPRWRLGNSQPETAHQMGWYAANQICGSLFDCRVIVKAGWGADRECTSAAVDRLAERLQSVPDLEIIHPDLISEQGRWAAWVAENNAKRVPQNVTTEERALLILKEHPEFSLAQIAKRLGCTRQNLTRKKFPEFHRVRDIIIRVSTHSIVKGPYDRNRLLEAADDDNPD